MERITTLIHRLKDKCEAGAHTAELLSLVDELRNELTRSKPVVDHTAAPISVWLPSGYNNHPPAEAKDPMQRPLPTVKKVVVPETVTAPEIVKPLENLPVVEKVTEEPKPATNGHHHAPGYTNGNRHTATPIIDTPPVVPVVEPKPIFSVPRPPQVLVQEAENTTAPAEVMAPRPLPVPEPVQKVTAEPVQKLAQEPEKIAHAGHLPIFNDPLNELPTTPLPTAR
ncbi:MAG TPA: hypothetical protein VK907_06130, partial [Phnomibacter sp.]|nr:hypothetical protein [Phnomibacter sp.]